MTKPSHESEATDRRTFVAHASTTFMFGSLALGYGAAGAIAARYLYPARKRKTSWQFVARVAELAPGESLSYRAPSGEKIAVACRGAGGRAEDFVALSSTCPHLGCQVHWQGHENRFFCPCHNGVFDTEGVAKAGPPAESGQRLAAYPLRVEGELLMIEVPVEFLSARKS